MGTGVQRPEAGVQVCTDKGDEVHELASDRAGTRGGKLRRSIRLWRGLPSQGGGPGVPVQVPDSQGRPGSD